MVDRISKEQRSINMSLVRNKNTEPELMVRKELFRRGYRYRLHPKLPGKPDIVFPKNKVAIFIHGCFWHQHNCPKGSIPRSNSEFWRKKLEINKKRDQSAVINLRGQGWRVITLWECIIKKDMPKVLEQVKVEMNT